MLRSTALTKIQSLFFATVIYNNLRRPLLAYTLVSPGYLLIRTLLTDISSKGRRRYIPDHRVDVIVVIGNQ